MGELLIFCFWIFDFIIVDCSDLFKIFKNDDMFYIFLQCNVFNKILILIFICECNLFFECNLFNFNDDVVSF